MQNPSQKETYPLPVGTFQTFDVPFPQGGTWTQRSLEGIHMSIYIHIIFRYIYMYIYTITFRCEVPFLIRKASRWTNQGVNSTVAVLSRGIFFPLDVPMTKITTISRKLQADFAVGNGKQNEISCRIFVRAFDFCHLKWSVCVYIYIYSEWYLYIYIVGKFPLKMVFFSDKRTLQWKQKNATSRLPCRTSSWGSTCSWNIWSCAWSVMVFMISWVDL